MLTVHKHRRQACRERGSLSAWCAVGGQRKQSERVPQALCVPWDPAEKKQKHEVTFSLGGSGMCKVRSRSGSRTRPCC